MMLSDYSDLVLRTMQCQAPEMNMEISAGKACALALLSYLLIFKKANFKFYFSFSFSL